MLLPIIVAFAVVGVACACRISSEQQHHEALLNATDAVAAAPAWRKLRRQILGTAAFVFMTFLLRAVFSIMNALANALQTASTGCTGACDTACSDMWRHIVNWLQFTPEFQLIVVPISSPLALLVALWGMTDKRELQHMRSSRGQTVRLLSSKVDAVK